MVIRNKLVKWYINNCEYMKIIDVNCGLRDESDLRSNEDYLSSSGNKAWKISGSCGIWTRHQVFERKVWTQSFPPLKQNFQGTSITFAWARVCKRSFGADVRSLFSIWMTTDNGKFLFLWNQNLLSFICLSVGTVYSRQSEPRHDAESHGKYGSECSATWRYRCIMEMSYFVQIERMSDK